MDILVLRLEINPSEALPMHVRDPPPMCEMSDPACQSCGRE